jgi:branched-chain amino acid aminotransferase
MATVEVAIRRVEKSRVTDVDFENLPFGSVFSDHMLAADYKDGKWEELRIVPYGPISIAPSASAFHYGQCIFEGFKAFRLVDDGIALFRVRDNLSRFNKSARRLAMPELSDHEFVDGIAELVRIDQDWVPRAAGAALYVRPTYFATDETLVVRPSSTYRFVVFTCPVGQYFSAPLRLVVEEQYVRAFPGGTGATKAAGNYAGSLLAGRLAQEKGFHSVVWLDGPTRSFVEESGLMNIFFVIKGVAITPPLGGTILPGITRDSVATLLRKMGIEVTERPIAMDELVDSYKKKELSAAFAVGTAATVAPIESIRYRDFDIHLPVTGESSLAERARARLESVRTGREPDSHGWLFHI